MFVRSILTNSQTYALNSRSIHFGNASMFVWHFGIRMQTLAIASVCVILCEQNKLVEW